MAAQELWSIHGSWTSVAVHPASDTVYALGHDGELAQFDRSGKKLSTVRVDGAGFGSTLRLANLAGDAEPEFVVFRSWGDEVQAFDRTGKPLWVYAKPEGVDDVWIADLDGAPGDHFDEVIVGYNGGAGVHAVNRDGKSRWINNEIGNVWHVTAGFPDDKGVPQVVTTSAQGVVHIFSATGASVGQKRPPGYANLVRLAAVKPDAEPLLVVSIDVNGGLAGMDRRGTALWTLDLQRSIRRPLHITGGAGAPNSPWFAVELANTGVFVIDAAAGRRLASVACDDVPSVAWLPERDGEPPTLVVAASGRVTAYRLREKAR